MPKKLINETSFRIAFKQKTKRYWMLVFGLLIQAERCYSVSRRFEAELR
jgi:hypothetical protein